MKNYFTQSIIRWYGDDPEPTPPANTSPAAFTQKEVDAFLAREREAYKKELATLTSKVTELTKGLEGEAKAKTKLEKLLEDAKKANMSAEELKNAALEEERTKRESEIKELSERASRWEGMYTDSAVNSALLKAAESHGAINPEQIRALLRSNTKMIPDANGALQIMADTTLNGKQVTVPVDQAVKTLADNKDYWNLFKGKGTGGAGTNPPGPAGSKSIADTSVGDLLEQAKKLNI